MFIETLNFGYLGFIDRLSSVGNDAVLPLMLQYVVITWQLRNNFLQDHADGPDALEPCSIFDTASLLRTSLPHGVLPSRSKSTHGSSILHCITISHKARVTFILPSSTDTSLTVIHTNRIKQ